jgi:hypothetical protein
LLGRLVAIPEQVELAVPKRRELDLSSLLRPKQARVRFELERYRSALPDAIEHLADPHGLGAQSQVVEGSGAGVAEQPFLRDKIIQDFAGSEVKELLGTVGRGIGVLP